VADTLKSQNVFYPALHDFCTKYFIVGPTPLTAADVQQFPARGRDLEASLFEHFLLFDTMSIKVNGDNLPLVFLLRILGLKRLEELIEQGAMKFVLWTPMILHFVQDIRGVNALAAGNATDSAHTDLEMSIDLGLNRLTDKPTKHVRKLLKRKVAPLYTLPPPDLAKQTVDITNSAYNSGKLRALGFAPERKSLMELTLQERQLLGKCATELLEYRYLISQGMTSLSEFPYFSFFANSIQRIASGTKVTSGFDELARFENFPDLKALYPTLEKGMHQLPKLRARRRSMLFREWLSSATAGDGEITREYLDAITNAKGPLDTKVGKLTKSIVMTTIGAAVGATLEGSVTGAAEGGIMGKVVEPAIDLGLDLLDEFMLDGLKKGWNPRMFFDDLRELEHPDLREISPVSK